MKNDEYQAVIVGCGRIGGARAEQIAKHPRSEVYAAVDPDEGAARALADEWGGQVGASWRELALREEVDVVVIATPPAYVAEIAIAALKAGKHVLAETPMGRSLHEAVQIAGVATSAKGVFKVGLVHRHHPALKQAHLQCAHGVIGDVVNIRARYGHGGRPGAEKTWRGRRDLAGGGALAELGVPVLDLINWFAGEPNEVFSQVQTAVWPLGTLEDSAFATMKWDDGKIAQLFASWTQWSDLFSFEVFGTRGALIVEGLGGRFGPRTLTVLERRPEGGPPYTVRTVYDEEDISWRDEWAELMDAITEGRPHTGSPSDGVTVMGLLDAAYRSAQSGQAVNP